MLPTSEKPNYTKFENQPIKLFCGSYECKNGIKLELEKTTWRFPQPILITKIIRNISRHTYKVELAFFRDGRWYTEIIDKKIIANVKYITDLATLGVIVNSENAKGLMVYLSTLETLNAAEKIPFIRATSSFGYVKKDNIFVPYGSGVEFDGQAEFRRLYGSINQKGDKENWIKKTSELFKNSPILNAVVSASFASVLLNYIGGHPFFLHLHGGESGTGKSAAQWLAASVWGEPNDYITTFNSSTTSLEANAGVCNELPLIINEYQLKNLDEKNQKFFNPYILAEGKGKGRSNSNLGQRELFEWNNVIITSGESPLSNENGGAGELNRIVEFEIMEITDLFPNEKTASEIYEFTRNEHGILGKLFVQMLYNSDEKIRNELHKKASNLVNEFLDELTKFGASDKQARFGAFVLAGNRLINNWFYEGDTELLISPKWFAEHLKTKEMVDITQRAYNRICDWIAINNNKFYSKRIEPTADGTGEIMLTNEPVGECYGEIDTKNNRAYIIKTAFDSMCKNYGFVPLAVLSRLKKNGLLDTANTCKRNTKKKRINGLPLSVVAVHLQSED